MEFLNLKYVGYLANINFSFKNSIFELFMEIATLIQLMSRRPFRFLMSGRSFRTKLFEG